jgi:hypothetical protein
MAQDVSALQACYGSRWRERCLRRRQLTALEQCYDKSKTRIQTTQNQIREAINPEQSQVAVAIVSLINNHLDIYNQIGVQVDTAMGN